MAVMELDFNKKEQPPKQNNSFTYSEKEFLTFFRQLSPTNRGRLLVVMENYLIEQNFPNDD